MSEEVVIELVCKAEGERVAVVRTHEGVLTASKILKGLEDTDKKRTPPAKLIMDGVQMTCLRCHEALYVRIADGSLYAAMPGSIEVQS